MPRSNDAKVCTQLHISKTGSATLTFRQSDQASPSNGRRKPPASEFFETEKVCPDKTDDRTNRQPFDNRSRYGGSEHCFFIVSENCLPEVTVPAHPRARLRDRARKTRFSGVNSHYRYPNRSTETKAEHTIGTGSEKFRHKVPLTRRSRARFRDHARKRDF